MSRRNNSNKTALTMIAGLLGPNVMAHFAYLFYIKNQIKRNNKSYVLCHSRKVFSKDIIQLEKHSRHIQWIKLSNSVSSAIQSAWIPEEARIQTHYIHKLNPEAKQWKLCNSFAEKLLQIIGSKVQLVAVLTANFDYWQDFSFRNVCPRNAVKFVVLRREHEVSEFGYLDSKGLYENYRIEEIDRIFVYSNKCRNYLARLSLTPFPLEKIVVTGPPRMDAFESSKERTGPVDSIVLYSYINGIYCEDPDNFWKVLDIVAKYTEQHKLRLVIKCKQTGDMDQLKKDLELRGLNYKSVEWSVNADFEEVLSTALCAVSYNSTVLLEMLHFPVNILIPFLHVSEMEKNDAILHDVNTFGDPTVKRVDTEKALVDCLDTFSSDPLIQINNEKRKEISREYMMWDRNYLSSHKVEDEILKLVEPGIKDVHT